MIDNFELKQKSIKRFFSLLWFLFILILVVSFFLYQKYEFDKIKQQQFQQASQATQEHMDHFFNKLLQYSLLPSLGADCKSILLPQIESIDFKNPQISGIVISDNNNRILCSTTSHEIILPKPSIYDPVLLGPIRKTSFENNIYLLQKQSGTNYFGIYLLGKVIDNNLQKKSLIQGVALEDSLTKQIIYQQERFKPEDPTIIKEPSLLLNNINYLILPYEKDLFKIFLLKQLAFISAFVLFSFLPYFYIRKFLIERASLKTAITTALEQKQFKPVYMPTWNETEQNYAGAEVLMRWYLHEDEVISPDFFIIEAEKSGLIVPMTLQLLETTFKDANQFLQTHPNFYLAFNLTMRHFKEDLFFPALDRLFVKYQINPKQIMFELTERELLNELDEKLHRRLKKFIKQGSSLAVDDFGTGHASINYLNHFPFTHLKIDQIFVQAIGTGAITESLNDSIIQLANTMKLKIIAEGVETKEQYDYLKKNKVNFMQGWYFSKALPFKNLVQLIHTLGKR